MSVTQQNRFLAVKTALGEDKLLIKDFSMTEQLGRLFHIQLDLRSEDRAIKFNDIVGTNATVRLKMPTGKTRYFNDLCTFPAPDRRLAAPANAQFVSVCQNARNLVDVAASHASPNQPTPAPTPTALKP